MHGVGQKCVPWVICYGVEYCTCLGQNWTVDCFGFYKRLLTFRSRTVGEEEVALGIKHITDTNSNFVGQTDWQRLFQR